MLNNNEVKQLAEKFYKTDFSDVEVLDAPGVYVEINNGVKKLGGATVPQKLRAFTLYMLNKDEKQVAICQTPKLKGVGAMVATSQGGVKRPEKMKEFILKMAMFGGDRFLLYMDDTYLLEDYPRFGHLRGAYTDDELRDIVNFGNDIGVDIIPCIQVLGHLGTYLAQETSENKAMRDTKNELMCDTEETYKFVEAMITKLRSIFTSKRIHIGMDETHTMGTGQYLEKYGYKDRITTYIRHMAWVADLCKKNDFEPMIWSDMMFNFGIGAGSYYLPEITFSQEIIDSMPEVSLMYWDYYTQKTEEYVQIISNHKQLKRPVLFAGCGRVECGVIPDFDGAFKASLPALEACYKAGVEEAWFTLWGSGSHFESLYTFSAYSEMCYNPENTSREEMEKIGSLVTGISRELAQQMNKFFAIRFPESVIFNDVFFNKTGRDFTKETRYLEAKPAAEACKDEYVKSYLWITYYQGYIYANLLGDYKAGKDLKEYADVILPGLLENYKTASKLYTEKWLSEHKVFGLESYTAQYGAAIARVEYALSVMKKYVNKEISNIEELEYTPIYGI